MLFAYLFLAAAIVSELVGTTATKLSNGFTKPLPSVIAVVGVVGAYLLLSRSLKLGMQLGVAYAIWAGVGVVSVALIGFFAFHDRLTLIQGAGIAAIVGGVVALELGGSHG